MIIYIITFLISIFFAFLADNIKKQYAKYKTKKLKIIYLIFCFFAFLLPFLVSAFRDFSIGTDTSGTYKKIYYIVLNESSVVRDFGYAFINKIAIWLFNDYSGLLIITSLIFCSLSYKSIFSESKYPVLSVILFFTTNVYFISMNMIRQSIATAFFIVSIPYIKEKKFFKYFILNIIAISIHSTSIVYLFLYFLLKKKLKIKNIIIIILIIMLFGGLLSSSLIEFLCEFEYFRKYFAWYLTSQFATGDLNLFSLISNLIVLLFLFMINKEAKEDENYNILLWLETLSVLSLLLSSSLPMMQRISWLFSFPLYIYLPGMFDFIKNYKFRPYIKVCIFSYFILYMIITIFIKGYNEVVPYISNF